MGEKSLGGFRSSLPHAFAQVYVTKTLGLHLRRVYVGLISRSFASFSCHDDPVVLFLIRTAVPPTLKSEVEVLF